MVLQIINNQGKVQNNIIPTRVHGKVAEPPAFKGHDSKDKVPTKVKVGVFCTTFAGVLAAMLFMLKRKGYSLKPKEFIKGLMNVKYDHKKPEIETLVSALAIGSVGGGLIGGAIFDKKENMKAKYREAVIQLIGNIATPLVCVIGGNKLFGKIEPKVIKAMKLKGNTIEKIPGVLVSACCLVSGIFMGNKVGNTINEKVFHVKDNRKLKLTDMAPHLDDTAAGILCALPQSGIGTIIARIIPAALMFAGYEVGTTQEKHIKERKAA